MLLESVRHILLSLKIKCSSLFVVHSFMQIGTRPQCGQTKAELLRRREHLGQIRVEISFFFFITFSESMFCSQGDMENVVMGECPRYHVPHYVCMWMEGRGWSEATLPRATIHDDGPFLFWNRRKEGADRRKELNPSCHQHFSSKLLSKSCLPSG